MSEYVVEGKSRDELRKLACVFREVFGLRDIVPSKPKNYKGD